MDAFDDDLVLCAAPFLRSRDLLSLALTCKRFGGREVGRGWSLAEEAARTVLAERRTREERERLPKREGQTWLSLHSEWENYRTPPSFDQLIGVDAKFASEDNFAEVLLGYSGTNTSISDQVMRSGRHCISFRCEGSDLGAVSVGIMRPAKGLSKIINGTRSIFHPVYSFGKDYMSDFYSRYSGWNCCMYDIRNGLRSRCDRFHSNGDSHLFGWEGRPVGEVEEVGMVLDLDEGSLTAYRNGEQEWVQRNLTGKFCWVAVNHGSWAPRACIHIGRGDGLPHAQSS